MFEFIANFKWKKQLSHNHKEKNEISILTFQITSPPNWKIDRLDCARRQLSPPLDHNNTSSYTPIANLAHYSN